jgi:hypothetical protein
MGGGHAGEASRGLLRPAGSVVPQDPYWPGSDHRTVAAADKAGFRTAAEAGRARRDLLQKIDAGFVRPTPAGMTVNDLLDLYLDGIEADGRLSTKTCFNYRHYAPATTSGRCSGQ